MLLLGVCLGGEIVVEREGKRWTHDGPPPLSPPQQNTHYSTYTTAHLLGALLVLLQVVEAEAPLPEERPQRRVRRHRRVVVGDAPFHVVVPKLLHAPPDERPGVEGALAAAPEAEQAAGSQQDPAPGGGQKRGWCREIGRREMRGVVQRDGAASEDDEACGASRARGARLCAM